MAHVDRGRNDDVGFRDRLAGREAGVAPAALHRERREHDRLGRTHGGGGGGILGVQQRGELPRRARVNLGAARVLLFVDRVDGHALRHDGPALGLDRGRDKSRHVEPRVGVEQPLVPDQLGRVFGAHGMLGKAVVVQSVALGGGGRWWWAGRFCRGHGIAGVRARARPPSPPRAPPPTRLRPLPPIAPFGHAPGGTSRKQGAARRCAAGPGLAGRRQLCRLPWRVKGGGREAAGARAGECAAARSLPAPPLFHPLPSPINQLRAQALHAHTTSRQSNADAGL